MGKISYDGKKTGCDSEKNNSPSMAAEKLSQSNRVQNFPSLKKNNLTQSEPCENSPPLEGRQAKPYTKPCENSPPLEEWQAKPCKNSPPLEGWQAKPCENSPPLEEWQAKPCKNSPPLEGWQAKPDGVVKRDTKAYMALPFNPALRKRARQLRKAGMLHEVLLWQRLKRKQFHGLDFDRQKIIGNYIVDFYCASASLVIEVDCISHNNKVAYDRQRDAYLESLGLHVIHIRAVDVLQNIDGVMQSLTTPALRATPPREGN